MHPEEFKELQNRAWANVPAEFRKEVREAYKESIRYAWLSATKTLNKLFGNHNLTSDTEPEEERIYFRRRNIIRDYADKMAEKGRHDITQQRKDQISGWISCLKYLFGSKCLPDKVPEPKLLFKSTYHIGDVVKIVGSCCIHRGNTATLVRQYQAPNEYNDYKEQWVIQMSDGQTFQINEEEIEPYTAPTDKAEEKELDLCKILRGHENEGFFSPYHGNIKLVKVNDGEIIFSDATTHKTFSVTNKGTWGSCFCTIFPGKGLYWQYPLEPQRAWAVWSEQQKPKRWTPSVGDRFYFVDAYCEVDNKQWNNPYKPDTWDCGNCFKFPEDAECAAQELKKCLERVHEELNKKKV